MNVKEAVDFVRAICPDTNHQDAFTGVSAVMVSTLSTMIHLASHVQELSAHSKEMDNVSLGIYGSVRGRGTVGRKRLITLLGPRLELGEPDSEVLGEDRGNGAGLVATTVGAHALATRVREIRPRPSAESHNVNRVLGEQINGDPHGENLARKGIYGAAGSLAKRGPGTVPARMTYRVPDEVAMKCISYLLDISGSTSHPRSSRGRDIDNINARRVTSAVKAIFKKHTALISRTGVDKNKIRYTSLVPDGIKGKEVLLPRIRVSRNRTGLPYMREGEVKTNLSISKADRNSKAQNIAFIASLLHHRGHGVDVEGILREHGFKGLGEEGCLRFAGCRLGMPCKDAPKDTCFLYNQVNGERKMVGKGSPNPFLTFILGKEIPQSAIAMRVKSISCSAGLENRRNDGFALPDSWYVWPKCDVGRVEFLGRLKNVLGTAILVYKLFPDGAGGDESGGGGNATNISDAVLLCDVDIVEGLEKERYPFGEWYENGHVRKIRDLRCKTPTRFSDVVSQNARQMLWSSGWIREARSR